MEVPKHVWTLLVVGTIIVQLVIVLHWSAPPQQPGESLNRAIEILLLHQHNTISHQDDNIYSSFLSHSPLPILPYPISKDLIVFSAHFDSRPQRNHSNITLIIIGASRKVINQKLIIGCGVGSINASEFRVRYVQEDHLMHTWKGKKFYPYDQLVVECYDLPVTPGSKAFVIYRTDSMRVLAIQTNKPVVIPEPRSTPKGRYNFSVVVCTKAHTRGASWVPEFLRYQKTLGVDHVHLTILDEFIKDGGFHDYLANDSFFLKHLNENYITVQVWKEWYTAKEWYVHATILMYLDCLYRYRGTYDFVSLMDTDDFFTVRVPGMTYKDMIQKYCMGANIGSCHFDWLFYYPGICGLKNKTGEDGNVTAALNPHKAVNEQHRLKSIHNTAAVVDSSFHDATCKWCLLKGYKVVHVPSNIAYVAHNRMYKHDPKKNCHNH